MTLSFTNPAVIKQYLPGLYFIAISTWIGFENQNFWMALIVIAFIMQMVLNNRYLNLILGCITIVASVYLALTMFADIERSFKFISIALSLTIVNLYMSRMLFLNQNFAMSTLRENSLDDTLFL